MQTITELICGNSLQVMQNMIRQGRFVDLVVTDPPYELTNGGKNTGEMGGCFSKDVYDNSGSIVECDIEWSEFMPFLYGILQKGHAYIMCNNRNVRDMLNAADAAGFSFHNLLVWDKVTATPNRWYQKNCEFVGFFFKGKAKKIKDCGSKQLIRCSQNDDLSGHPTQKPVALFEHYIRNSSEKYDTVLDPFMGVGSCGIAAKNLERNFIGIEINKKWFDCAYKNINRSEHQTLML